MNARVLGDALPGVLVLLVLAWEALVLLHG